MDKSLERLAEILGIRKERMEEAVLQMGSEEEGEEGCGEVNPEGFYFNPIVFRKLHSIDYEGLRKLVIPNISKLRR